MLMHISVEKHLLRELRISEPGPRLLSFLLFCFFPQFFIFSFLLTKQEYKNAIVCLNKQKEDQISMCRRKERKCIFLLRRRGWPDRLTALNIVCCVSSILADLCSFPSSRFSQSHYSHWPLLPKARLQLHEKWSTGLNYTVFNLQRVSHKASKVRTARSS